MMKGMVYSREKNITLKQYITSHSLSKRIAASCKEKAGLKHKRDESGQTSSQIIPPSVKLTKDGLLLQIKQQLRELITSDKSYVALVRMIDKLVEVLYLQIKDRHKENEVLQNLLRESTTNIEVPVRRSVRDFKNSLVDQRQIVKAQNKPNLNIAETATKNMHKHNHVRSPSIESNLQIPNINVLIPIKNEGVGAFSQTESSIVDYDRSILPQDSRKSFSFSEDDCTPMPSFLRVEILSEDRFLTPQTNSPAQSIIKMSVPPSEKMSDAVKGSPVSSRVSEFKRRREI